MGALAQWTSSITSTSGTCSATDASHAGDRLEQPVPIRLRIGDHGLREAGKPFGDFGQDAADLGAETGVEATGADRVRVLEQRRERLDERLVRNVVALVAPTGDDDGALTMCEPREARDETGLADARLSGDEDDALLAVSGRRPCLAQHIQFVLAPDELLVAARQERRQRGDGVRRGDRVALAWAHGHRTRHDGSAPVDCSPRSLACRDRRARSLLRGGGARSPRSRWREAPLLHSRDRATGRRDSPAFRSSRLPARPLRPC